MAPSRLSIQEARLLPRNLLAKYHNAVADFLIDDSIYGEHTNGQTPLLWQEVLLAFPGHSDLRPLPIHWDTLNRIVQIGRRLSTKQVEVAYEWNLSQAPTQLYLTPTRSISWQE